MNLKNITPTAAEKEELNISGFFNKGKSTSFGDVEETSEEEEAVLKTGESSVGAEFQKSSSHGSRLKKVIETQELLSKDVKELKKDIFQKFDIVFGFMRLVMSKLGVTADEEVCFLRFFFNFCILYFSYFENIAI